MDQVRITEPTDLLDERGHLLRAGWATAPLWRYDPARVKGGRLFTKEWDYYAVLDPDQGIGLTLTLADLGYLSLATVCWLNLDQGRFVQQDRLGILPLGKLGLGPGSGDGKVVYVSKSLSITLDVALPARRISIQAPGFTGPGREQGLEAEVELHQDPGHEAMVIATPWAGRPECFYYNHKQNCMPATGRIRLGDRRFELQGGPAMGVLDWGRGRWTWRNRWFWASASGLHQGQPFGFNLGYGFSDRSAATENMLFFGGRAHKLGAVHFDFDPTDFMKPWRLVDEEGRLDLTMEPLVDRNGKTDLGLIRSIQHQVFGRISGRAVLDDGEVLEIRDLLGFAEDVLNWW